MTKKTKDTFRKIRTYFYPGCRLDDVSEVILGMTSFQNGDEFIIYQGATFADRTNETTS